MAQQSDLTDGSLPKDHYLTKALGCYHDSFDSGKIVDFTHFSTIYYFFGLCWCENA